MELTNGPDVLILPADRTTELTNGFDGRIQRTERGRTDPTEDGRTDPTEESTDGPNGLMDERIKRFDGRTRRSVELIRRTDGFDLQMDNWAVPADRRAGESEGLTAGEIPVTELHSKQMGGND